MSQGTPDELRTTYGGGVVNARTAFPNVEIVMVFGDGTAISLGDL